MSLINRLQKYVRSTQAPRHFVKTPQFDEQAGFGEVKPQLSAAELLETPMRAIPVGECAIEENPFAYFMDGIQRSWLLYYQDRTPVYYGYTAAVVRHRAEAVLTTWQHQQQEALYLPFNDFDAEELLRLRSNQMQLVNTTSQVVELAGEEAVKQPLLQREGARVAIAHSRESLEARLTTAWIDEHQPGWLVMDGAIGIAAAAVTSERVVGLIKSHNTQYFDFPEQEVIFNLKVGERSSCFMPKGRHEVCSWYLRLREDNADFYFGLIRVEAALRSQRFADEISRWILTERRPLSLPDARWDRMIYPIRNCEQYLRSQEPSSASFGWLG